MSGHYSSEKFLLGSLNYPQYLQVPVSNSKSHLFSRAILHTPFIPFSILFTQAVQLLDRSDLARIERFAASLKPAESDAPAPPPTHPYRIYELLSRTARLCVESHTQSLSLPAESTLIQPLPGSLSDFDLPYLEMETGGPTTNNALVVEDHQIDGLSDWYYSNQQIMNLMDEDVISWSY